MHSTMIGGTIKVASITGKDVEGDEEWNDGNGNKSEIAQILIWHGKRIYAIQTQYVENGNLVLSQLHGSTVDATKFDVVQFDNGGGEFLTEMNCICSEEGYVTSLSICTSKGYNGSFGAEESSGDQGKRFKFGLGQKFGGQFCGFWGSANPFGITSIGICLKPVTSLDDVNIASDPFSGIAVANPIFNAQGIPHISPQQHQQGRLLRNKLEQHILQKRQRPN